MNPHPLLLHSISYSGSWGQHFFSLEDFAGHAAQLGYDGLLIAGKRPHLSVLDWNATACSQLAATLQRLGLKENVIAGYTNFTADLEHGDIPRREMQVRHVIELAERARDIGAKSVRVFTGYENPAARPQAAWRMVVDCLRQCAERAAAFGVTIGVQNHHDIACDYRSMLDLVREIDHPNCRAMFDAWAPALQGTSLTEAGAALGASTIHTTVANYVLRPRFRYLPDLVNYEPLTPSVQAVPMSQGFIDYRAFFAAMEQAGFQGSIAYEMCSPLAGGGSLENLDRYARDFLDFMRR